MDSSKFHVVRACVSFFFVDRELAGKEREWLEARSAQLKVTPEQKAQLEIDLQKPPALEELLPKITKPSDRAFLVDQLRIASFADGNFSEAEKRKIQELKKIVMGKVDLLAAEKKVQHEQEMESLRSEISFLESLNSWLTDILD